MPDLSAPMDVQPVTLTGRTLRLEPLNMEHASALRRVAEPDIFTYGVIMPREWTDEGWLDYMRRFARGELAAVLGPSALAGDRTLRTLDIAGAAEASLPALTEEEAETLDGIAAGINAWAERCPALPLEFEPLGYEPTPWRPVDSILLWKYRWWTLTGRLEQVAPVAAAGQSSARYVVKRLACTAAVMQRTK